MCLPPPSFFHVPPERYVGGSAKRVMGAARSTARMFPLRALALILLVAPLAGAEKASDGSTIAGSWFAVRGTPSVESTVRVFFDATGYAAVTFLPTRDGVPGPPFTVAASQPDVVVKVRSPDVTVAPVTPHGVEDLGAEYVFPPGHNYEVVVFLIGEIVWWEYDVLGATGDWVETGRGDDVLVLDEADMDGGPALSARADVSVHASVDSELRIGVNGRAFGWFGGVDPGDAPAHFLTAVTPEGVMECACAFYGMPSGQYRFISSGAGVQSVFERPFLVLADIP